MSESGPGLTTWALQQVVSFLEYTCRQTNVVVTAAHDPKRSFVLLGFGMIVEGIADTLARLLAFITSVVRPAAVFAPLPCTSASQPSPQPAASPKQTPDIA
jgi:hypothetical protein